MENFPKPVILQLKDMPDSEGFPKPADLLVRQIIALTRAHHLGALWTTPATQTARLVTASAL